MTTKQLSHYFLHPLVVLAILGIAVFIGVSCATAQGYKGKFPGKPVEGGKVRLELDFDNLDIRVIEPADNLQCKLCTEDPVACEKAWQGGANICYGLVNATVQAISTITLIRSRRNPQCITIDRKIVGGKEIITQLCRCLPGETTCPAPMWTVTQ